MTFQVSKTGGREVDVCPTLDCRCCNGAMQGAGCLGDIGAEAVACWGLASGKDVVGTLSARQAEKSFLGNQDAFSGDYFILEPK